MYKYLYLFLLAATSVICPTLFSQQVIDGSGGPISVTINSTGQSDGVSFINQTVPNECTLLVNPGNTINSKKKSSGISTDGANLGNVNFQSGSSSTTKTFGTLGSSAFPLDTFNVNCNVEFNSNMWVNTVLIGAAGNASIQNSLTLGSGGLGFPTAGLVNLAENGIINGNVGSSFLGSLNMNNNTVINGNVLVLDFTLNGSGLSNKVATINGNYGALDTTVNDGSQLIINGDVGFPNLSTITLSDSAPPIAVSDNATQTGSMNLITYDFSFERAPPPLKTEPLVFDILTASSGTTLAEQIPARTNDARVTGWTGQMVNGTIQIIAPPINGSINPPVNIPNEPSEPWWLNGIDPSANITGGTRDIFLNLLPLADSYRGTDLDFVEGQLISSTMTEYGKKLYQLYPAPALIGVAPETFNTYKQFQKVWLEHLNRYRTHCVFANDEDSCCVCYNNDVKVWLDGFSYHGRRSNSDPGKGYHANTSGTSISAETMISDEFIFGASVGYAYSHLKKGQFILKNRHTNFTNFYSYQGSLYFSYNLNNWYMDTGLSVGFNRYKGKRYIDLRDIHRNAHATYGGQNYSTFITSGFQWYCRDFLITPFASMVYYYLHMNRYHERGAKSLNLNVNSQNYRFLESGLGIKAAYFWETCYGSFIPEVHTIWYHDYNQDNVNVRASFSQEAGTLGGFFRNRGPKVDRDYWNIGATITCMGDTNLKVLLNYDYEASNHYVNHQGLLELSYIY